MSGSRCPVRYQGTGRPPPSRTTPTMKDVTMSKATDCVRETRLPRQPFWIGRPTCKRCYVQCSECPRRAKGRSIFY